MELPHCSRQKHTVSKFPKRLDSDFLVYRCVMLRIIPCVFLHQRTLSSGPFHQLSKRQTEKHTSYIVITINSSIPHPISFSCKKRPFLKNSFGLQVTAVHLVSAVSSPAFPPRKHQCRWYGKVHDRVPVRELQISFSLVSLQETWRGRHSVVQTVSIWNHSSDESGVSRQLSRLDDVMKFFLNYFLI